MNQRLKDRSFAAGPLAPLYYSGQFVPLIVFFLLFLAIVKNNKLHHFVRFHCMQVSLLVFFARKNQLLFLPDVVFT